MSEAIGGASGVQRWRPHGAVAAAVVSAVWTTPVPAGTSSFRVLPDAHIDLVWDGVSLRVAGPDTMAKVEELPAGATVVGLQIAPGAAATVLGVPAAAVLDERVDLADLWGPAAVAQVLDRLDRLDAERGAPEESAWVIEDAVTARTARGWPADGPVDALAAELRRRVAAGAAVRTLSDLGISERQLRRRCVAAFGYAPKVLARILRFQRFLDRLAVDRATGLASLAAQCGYADQSHLTHDVVAFAGIPPGDLRARLMSDTHKTPAV